jgi:hypothetical protein
MFQIQLFNAVKDTLVFKFKNNVYGRDQRLSHFLVPCYPGPAMRQEPSSLISVVGLMYEYCSNESSKKRPPITKDKDTEERWVRRSLNLAPKSA